MTTEIRPQDLLEADRQQADAITQLMLAYEAILTEMRTHAKADRLIAEWVRRADSARDEFVRTMLEQKSRESPDIDDAQNDAAGEASAND